MNFKEGRYSGLITPISYLIDLVIINLAVYQFFLFEELALKHIFTISALWTITSVFNRYYYIYRYTNFLKIINLLFNQIVLLALSLFCFAGIFPDLNLEPPSVFKLLTPISISIIFVKTITYYSLKTFRSYFGGNYRKTIIIGDNIESQNLEFFFNTNKDAGYLHQKTFLSTSKESVLESIRFVEEQEIDEIYCSTEDIKDEELKMLIKYCDNNLKTIKLIPNPTKLNSKKLIYETYDSLPILSLRKVPLQDSVNMFFKRLTDIVLSLSVIIFILSWLTPIIALFIKKASTGPVFFKQIRNGINYKEFSCLKFRSMIVNQDAHKQQATKGDYRVTNVGKFLAIISLEGKEYRIPACY